MARQLNVNLVFNANTAQAKQQMASLQTSINQIQSSLNQQVSMGGFTSELAKAQNAAINLKTSLNSAFNVDTGKLDLNKFNLQLQQSGMKLSDYRAALQQLGPEGRNAFNQLTSAIVQGQMPMQKTKNLLTSMMDTFGSSIKWSIAYSAINKISQGFSDAFQYAKDLNESLTNIRVVTGLGAEEMTAFAEKANKAAKALGATTTAFTDAALIYYQQGLDGKAVEERAETTLKLANVTGQSAQEVSDQMTAVWNNFYDGGKSIEYYADVLTALGAATASSTDEIAQGLEKFAAVANTVGLSYEYATTALATVTAQTRQSADVVGTAFKTLFARIQDLDLGKTLEDGTTLGSYSQALQAVGVNIKDASGDLKDMDLILNEMGAKWKQIDKDQQVALAKSVAGIRQYTQLIALMDNWDTFQINLATAEGAEGTLQEQQDIWAESWEAAEKRVQASVEDLYNSLIDDKFFIDLNNVFADLLSGLDEFIDAIGGLKTLLPLIGGLMLKTFGPMALNAITNTFGTFKGQAEQMAAAQGLKSQALQESISMGNESDSYGSRAQASAHEHTLNLLKEIEGIHRDLSKVEIEELQSLQAKSQEWNNILVQSGQYLDTLDAAAAKLKETQTEAKFNADISEEAILDDAPNSEARDAVAGVMDEEKKAFAKASKAQVGIDSFNNANVYTEGKYDPEKAKAAAQTLARDIRGTGQKINGFTQTDLKNFDGSEETFRRITAATKDLNPVLDQTTKTTKKLAASLKDNGYKDSTKKAKAFAQSQGDLARTNAEVEGNSRKSSAALEQYGDTAERINAEQEKLIASAQKLAATPLSQTMINLASGIGSAAAGFSMLSSGISKVTEMFETGEHSISGWLTALTSIGFAIPMVVSGVTALSGAMKTIGAKIVVATTATKADTAEIIKNNIVKGASKAAADTEQKESGESAAAIQWETIKLKELNAEQLKAIGLKKRKDGLYIRRDGQMFNTDRSNTFVNAQTGDMTLGELQDTNNLNFNQNSASMMKNKASIGTTLKGIGSKIATAAPVILGIAAAVGSIILVNKMLDKTFNKESKAMKSAQAAADQLKKQYDQISTATQNMKNTMEEYSSATDSLHDLAKGTVEYKEALMKANEQAMALIKTNQNLKYSIIEGQIIIDQTSLNEAYSLQLDKQKDAMKSYNVGLQSANSAKMKSNESEYAKSVNTSHDILPAAEAIGSSSLIYGAGGTLTGAGLAISGSLAAGAGWGASIGSAATPIGAAIGAIIGLIVGGIVAAINVKDYGIAAEEEKQALEAIQKRVRENPDLLKDKANTQAYLKEEGFDSALIDALTKDMTALENLVLSNEALRNQNQALNQTIASAVMESRNKDGSGSRAMSSYLDSRTVEVEGYDKDWNEVAESISDNGALQEKLYNLFYDRNTEGYVEKSGLFGGSKATRYYYDESGHLQKEEIEEADLSRELVAKIREATLSGDTGLMAQIYQLIKEPKDKQIIEKYEVTKEDIDEIEARFNMNKQALLASGLDKKNDIEAIEIITGQLEDDFENIDFGVLTSKQYEAIKNGYEQGLYSYNAEVKEKINKGIQEYWQDRARSKIKATVNFEAETYEAEELQSILTKAEMTQADFNTYVRILQEEYGYAKEEAEELAKAQLDAIGGINTLTKAINTYRNALEKGIKANALYVKGITDIANKISEWSGVAVTDKWVENNLSVLLSAADGAYNSIEELYDLLAQAQVDNMGLNSSLEATQDLYELVNQVGNMDIAIGVTMNTDDTLYSLVDTINQLIATGQIDISEGAKLLTNLGFGVSESDYIDYSASKEEQQSWSEETKKAYSDGKIKILNASSIQSTGRNLSDQFDDLWKEAQKKQQERLEYIENERDLYYELEDVVKDTTRALDKLSDAKDKAYGANKSALIEEEIKQQEKQLDTYNELLDKAEQDHQNKKDKLLDNFAVQIDKDGDISNYDEIQKKLLDDMEEAAKAGNVSQYDQAKEKYDEFKNLTDKYRDSLDKVEEYQDKIRNTETDILNSNLEKIENNIESQIEMAEDEKAAVDYLAQKMKNDPTATTADKIANLTKGMESVYKQIEANQQGIEEVERAVNAGEISEAQATEKLREYRDELISLEEEMQETSNTVHEELTNAIEEFNEEIDRGVKTIEHYGKVTENYKNIVDIVGKDLLGMSNEAMEALDQVTVSNSTAMIESVKSQLDANNKTLDNLRQKRAEAEAKNDEQAMAKWDEQIKAAEEKSQELTTTLQDTLSTGLEAAAEVFGNTIQRIADNFSKTVSGIYDSIEQMRESWDRQQEVADRFLDTYEKTYEINKLNRSIQSAMDKTDNVGAKKELHALQQEMLDMSKDDQQLSKYDLEYLQKKYDLLVAEQALKDAQNAKSVVRLQRDSEGNFGYVYTADQNSVDNAQQNYEDKLYAFQQYSDKMDQELAEMYISVQEQAYERMQAAAEMYGEGTKEFERARMEILEQYNEDMTYITDEYEKLTGRNLDINRQFNAGVADIYQSTFLGSIAPSYNSFASLYSSVTDECEQASKRLGQAVIDLEVVFKAQFAAAGLDYENFKKNAVKELETIEAETVKAAGATKTMAEEMDKNLNGTDGAIAKVTTFQEAFVEKMKPVSEKIQEAIGKTEELTKGFNAIRDAANEAADAIDRSATGVNGFQNKTQDKKPITSSIVSNKGTSLGDINTLGVSGSYVDEVMKGASFETLERDDSPFSIYSATTGKQINVSNNELDDIKFTRANTEVRLIDGKEYILGKIDPNRSDYSQETKDTIEQLKKENSALEFYVARENLNAWGNSDWLDSETQQKKYDRVFVNPSKEVVYHVDDAVYTDTELGQVGANIDSTNKIISLTKANWDYLANHRKTVSLADASSKFKDDIDGVPIYNESTGKWRTPYWDSDGRKALKETAFKELKKRKIIGFNQKLCSFYLDKPYKFNTGNKDGGEGQVSTQWIGFGDMRDIMGKTIYSDKVVQLDTGGYTGDWGPEGRLAMLHQKEIVLNAHDTENFLTAIGIVRDISDQLERNALTMGHIQAATNYNSSLRTGGDILEQNVHITAEFPNATNHLEIEEAFRNLPLLASQYINRKN